MEVPVLVWKPVPDVVLERVNECRHGKDGWDSPILNDSYRRVVVAWVCLVRLGAGWGPLVNQECREGHHQRRGRAKDGNQNLSSQ